MKLCTLGAPREIPVDRGLYVVRLAGLRVTLWFFHIDTDPPNVFRQDGMRGVVCESCEDRRQQHCQTSKANEKTEKSKKSRKMTKADRSPIFIGDDEVTDLQSKEISVQQGGAL